MNYKTFDIEFKELFYLISNYIELMKNILLKES